MNTFMSWHLAQAHLPAMFTVPAVVLIGYVCVHYWVRLGRSDTPSPRRRVRRISLAIVMVELVMLLAASSLIDPSTRPTPYVVAWTIAMFLLIALVVLALLDYVTTVRLHVAAMSSEIEDETAKIRLAMKAAKEEEGNSE
ncbi:MAG: hypothetical protein MK085_13145 [Phycisphaerales bacterium]|nr:hypothetical protein [Phycisphaerales bacterium]